MFSLIYARINGWVNNREAGDLRRRRAHYNVIVMKHDIYTYYKLICITTIIVRSHLTECRKYVSKIEDDH